MFLMMWCLCLVIDKTLLLRYVVTNIEILKAISRYGFFLTAALICLPVVLKFGFVSGISMVITSGLNCIILNSKIINGSM